MATTAESEREELMERRKLLQTLMALPTLTIRDKSGEIAGKTGQAIGVKYETKPDKKYVVFLNAKLVDVDAFCSDVGNMEIIPAGTPIHPVWLGPDETMDDICRIYEIDKE